MEPTDETRELKDFHAPHRVRERLRTQDSGGLLRDAILGAVDGTITTFAVVAGGVGGGFSHTVIIVLGAASLLADSLSMAVSNYLGARSDYQRGHQARSREQRHIELVPKEQADELRQIFIEKGFEGETLERIVATVTRDRRLWVETVVSEEFGLPAGGTPPLHAAAATMAAFLLLGVLPLLPFLWPGLPLDTAFAASVAVTGLAFALVGMFKGWKVGPGIWRSALETVLTGGAAATLAYVVGYLLRQWIGDAAVV